MDRLNNLIIFDIFGPMAHFRKYYTNSSSLSYTFPPRTVVTGIIAGLLGWERDSYYEILSPDLCHVAVKIISPFRKVFQTVNYLFVTEESHFNGFKGRTMVPMEFVLPALGEKEVRYRIYFSHRDEKILAELAEVLNRRAYQYPPYLGISECIASVEPVATANVSVAEIPAGETVDVCTPVNCQIIQDGGIIFEIPEKEITLQYLKERMPLFFRPGRIPGGIADFVLEKNLQKLRLKLKAPAWKVRYGSHEEVIAFMEEGHVGGNQ